MNKFDTTDMTCISSLKLLGDYHILRIIDALETGPMRFCTVQRTVDNLNPATLTDRLKKLEQAGIIERSERPRNEKVSTYYSLTAAGQRAIPVLSAIHKFARQSA
jgi:DNA-binding HxlR family transcriptional regulator